MLRLRSCILTQILSSPCASHVSPLHRLLPAAAASAVSPAATPGFAAEEYLVSACGLTRAQAIKASTKLSHLKSPAKPDAVLAFLAGIGLSAADVATAVAKDPQLLCAKVEKTLVPVVDGLTGLGLSRSEIGRLASLAGNSFRDKSIVSKMQYYLPLLGSSENLFQVLDRAGFFRCSLERVVKPNVAFLQECGLGARDIAKLCMAVPRMFGSNPDRVRAMVACAEGIGIPRGSGMFRCALQAVACIREETIAAKVECLKKAFKWSDAEVGIAVSKVPMLLRRSNDFLRSSSEFLISEVGLEPAYIAQRPVIACLSLEGRLRPRYCVVKFLKVNGLLKRDPSYKSVFMMTGKVFVEKFICPHKEAAPYLAEDYAAACRGEVPVRFRFT